ncbi:hypothetical protein B0A49_07952 [Cryomyces minteri]|uniref:Uncharacterized protein n=1 Tax=Cryomyces minteri TaxID=331657 RepID=A0A4U0XAC1_9PEZI|nr:hypothetical protein B0A49_07952 [Cryomyces minteri]
MDGVSCFCAANPTIAAPTPIPFPASFVAAALFVCDAAAALDVVAALAAPLTVVVPLLLAAEDEALDDDAEPDAAVEPEVLLVFEGVAPAPTTVVPVPLALPPAVLLPVAEPDVEEAVEAQVAVVGRVTPWAAQSWLAKFMVSVRGDLGQLMEMAEDEPQGRAILKYGLGYRKSCGLEYGIIVSIVR